MGEGIIQLRSRAMSRQEEGFYCGMSDLLTVDAEIEASYNGAPVFFHARWCDAFAGKIEFEATSESVYELWARLEDDGNYGDILDECRARMRRTVEPGPELPHGFQPQLDALIALIKDELRANGISPASYKVFNTDR